jgi:hypothetical protein
MDAQFVDGMGHAQAVLDADAFVGHDRGVFVGL